MKEVTQDEFYASIKALDVHPRIEGNYRYTSRFVHRGGREAGRIEWDGKNRHLPTYKYLINN